MDGTVLVLAKQDTEVKPDDSQAKRLALIEGIKRKEEVCVWWVGHRVCRGGYRDK